MQPKPHCIEYMYILDYFCFIKSLLLFQCTNCPAVVIHQYNCTQYTDSSVKNLQLAIVINAGQDVHSDTESASLRKTLSYSVCFMWYIRELSFLDNGWFCDSNDDIWRHLRMHQLWGWLSLNVYDSIWDESALCWKQDLAENCRRTIRRQKRETLYY